MPYARMTPEQRADYNEKARVRAALRYAAMTPEQRAERIKAGSERRRARAAVGRPVTEYQRAKDDPEKLAEYRARNRARSARGYARKKAAADAARAAQARAWARESQAAFRHDAGAIIARITKALPRYLYADIREDVASEMAVALLSGEIALGEIEAKAKTYISRYLSSREWRRVLSMDMPMFEGSGKTLHDMLTTENAVLL